MKNQKNKLRAIITLLLIFHLSSLFSQNQQNVDVLLGTSLRYSLSLHTSGISIKAGIDLFKKVRFTPVYTKYLRTFRTNSGFGGGTKVEVDSWQADFYGQYLIETSDITLVYLSLGYGYYKETLTSSYGSQNEQVFNRFMAGIGIQVAVNRWKILGDFHYGNGGNYDFNPSLGFIYSFLEK